MTQAIKKVAIFCGAKMGASEAYAQGVQEFVDQLCKLGLTIVYGGANIGLMAVLANQALKNNGKIIGVIPKKLVDIEQAHKSLTDLHIVDSMTERKSMMAEISDAFVMLPGGTGSLDEFFEMFTLMQLGYQNKPCAILNINHYYDSLIKFLDHATKEGFLRDLHRDEIITADSSIELLKKMNLI